jgi:hypothetical protein
MKIRLTVVCLLSGLAALAQSSKTELLLHAGGGLSTFSYSLSEGEKSLGFGGNFGLAYNRVWNDSWGLNIGLALSTHGAEANIGGQSNVIDKLKDNEGDTYKLTSTIVSYAEKQNLTLLSIPIMLNYQTELRDRLTLYARAGLKIGIPLSATYTSGSIKLNNEIEYTEYGSSLPPGFEGAGEKSLSSNGKMALNTAFMAAAEAGLRLSFGDKHALYAGLYFDYGLNNMLSQTGAELLTLTDVEPYCAINGSVLSARHNGADRVSRLAPLAAGIKLTYAFDLSDLQSSFSATWRRIFLPSYGGDRQPAPYTSPYTAPLPPVPQTQPLPQAQPQPQAQPNDDKPKQ